VKDTRDGEGSRHCEFDRLFWDGCRQAMRCQGYEEV